MLNIHHVSIKYLLTVGWDKDFGENGFVCAYLVSQHNSIPSYHQLVVWQIEECQTYLEKMEFAGFTKV